MTTIAVVAHRSSTLGGGLTELREVLSAEGINDPLWYEVSDIRAAPHLARQARKEGADLLLSGEATAPCSAASMGWPTPEPR